MGFWRVPALKTLPSFNMLKAILKEISEQDKVFRLPSSSRILLEKEAPSWAESGKQAVQTLALLLPNVTCQGYAIAAGTSMDIRLRVSGSGFKKFITYPGWDNTKQGNILSPRSIIYDIYNQKIPDNLKHYRAPDGSHSDFETAKNNIRLTVRELVVNQLSKKFSVQLQEKIDEAVQNADKTGILGKIQANIARYDAAKHKAALARLKEVLQSFRYSEEDVISTWNEVKVEQVLKD